MLPTMMSECIDKEFKARKAIIHSVTAGVMEGRIEG